MTHKPQKIKGLIGFEYVLNQSLCLPILSLMEDKVRGCAYLTHPL